MSVEVLDELARARAAFDTWRAGRSGVGRIPDHLWALAESLVDHHSLQTVARELGLNPGRLHARLERRSASSPKARSSKPTLVELRAAVPELAAASSTGSVELSGSLSVGVRFGMGRRFYDRGPCSQSSTHIRALNSRSPAEGIRLTRHDRHPLLHN
jgi:transposase-like protein